MTESKVIGIDLGGTKLRAALLDEEGQVLAHTSLPTEASRGLEHVLNNIEQVINTVVETFDVTQVLGIGIGACGPLNPKTGVVYAPPNLPGWSNVPLRNILERRTGLPVFLGNDANLAALGEYTFGAAKNYRHAVYITVSTGIGAGIIEDGQILNGAKGSAGEIGHMTIQVDGPACNCGNRGCLEALASGTAIGRRARTLLTETSRPSLLRQLCADNPNNVNAEMVERAARQGDEVGLELLLQTAVYLGVGVTNALHLYNPEIVVIGGGVSRMGDILFEPLRAEVEKRTMFAFRHDVPVVPTQLGDDIGLYGAVALVMANKEVAIKHKENLQQRVY